MSASVSISASPRSPAAANLALVGLFWVWLFGELWFEWSVSEQYGYGLFVPFLGAYLLWLRVADCPAPRPWRGPFPMLAVLALAALAIYPIAILFAANADWRLLPWSLALLALGSTVLLLARWGGLPWVRHFLPALVLFLFAVPWPSTLEIPLVDNLMTFVASVTTEALHLLGYEAVQQGHTIQLPAGYVAVEEACSGVRSIQSTIMAGWLVGELWRFRLLGRLLLLVWASTVAVSFNLLRTFILSWITAASGSGVMERWHDTAGYLVFGLSFATVLGGAWLARPREVRSEKPDTSAARPAWLPAASLLPLFFLLLGPLPAVVAWYSFHTPANLEPDWRLDLPAAAPAAKSQTPTADLAQSLFTSEGLQASWVDASGRQWLLYYFVWRHARAAQLGGVHVPLRCLPAVGWVLDHQGPDLAWTRESVTILFNSYIFTHGATRIAVFYGQWDPAAYPYYEKTGRFISDRILDAWQGQRMADKHLLEIGIVNPASLSAAARDVHQFLNRAISLTGPSSAPSAPAP